MRSRGMQTGVGALIWLGLLAAGGFYIQRDLGQDQRGTVAQVARYFALPRQRIELDFPSPQLLYIGEPLFERIGDRFVRVGEVVATSRLGEPPSADDSTDFAIAEVYSSVRPLSVEDRCVYVPSSESMGWVVQSLMPPETRAEIGRLVTEAYRVHYRELSEQLAPLVRQTISQAAVIVWEDLNRIVAERAVQLQEIGERYQVELIDRRLVPLLATEIWPIVVEEASPLLTQIAEEIWQRTSLWSFGWRYLYDLSPLPQQDLTRNEFERLLRRDAAPVVQRHFADLLRVQHQIVSRIASNPEVRRVLVESLRQVADDPQVQALAIDAVRDVLLGNQRLSRAIADLWNSPAARQAVDLANRRLEYTITAIGETLFGNPHIAITPEFSRVLRYKVLRKDYHWFLVQRGGSDAAPCAERVRVELGDETTENPFHVPVESQR